jgi:hypothetical protein
MENGEMELKFVHFDETLKWQKELANTHNLEANKI